MWKVLLALLGIVGVAVAAAAGGAWWFLSRFDAKAEIERRVEAATGRDFVLAGPVAVSIWPTIGFRGEGAALANVRGGIAPHLLSAKEIVVGVALEPLLRTRRLEVSRFVLVEPVLSLEVDAQGLPNWILKPQAPPTPAPQAPEGERRVTDVQLAGAEIRDGRIAYVNARTKSDFALTGLNLMVDMAGLDAPLAVKGDMIYRGQLLAVDVNVGKARAVLTGKSTPLAFSLNGVLGDATFKGDIEVSNGALEGDVTAKGPSLRNLASWAGAPLGAGYGLETFALGGRVTVGARRYAFENAGLQIDDIKARGDFVVEQGPRVPFISGRIEIADLEFDPLSGAGKPIARRMMVDLNPYMAGRGRAATASADAAFEVASLQAVDVSAPGGWSTAKFNFGWMKTLNTQLEITTGPLKIHNVTMDNASLSFVLLDGYLSATLHRMELYGGQGSSRIEVDARQGDIVVRNELAAQNLRAKDFFRDAFGFTNLEGTAKVEWGLSSRGGTQKALMATSSGAGSAVFTNGVLTGVDLGGVAKTIRNAMRRELVSPSARTPFTNLSMTFRAADGVIATQDFRLDAADARISAIGVIDAGNRSLDLRLVPRLGVTALAVPFRVQGPWTGLAYSSDILGRARSEVEGKARAVIAKAPRR